MARDPGHFPFRIGVAAVDITPPVGVTLAGYKPRSADRVGFRLRAESLYCSDGNGCWLLICGDFLGGRLSWTASVRARISDLTGVPAEAILIAGTHTHSGPLTVSFREEEMSDVDRAYFSQFLDQLVGVAQRSVARAKPGRFEVVDAEAPQFLSNRRVIGSDGLCTNVWQDPEGRHTGYADPSLLIAIVRRPDHSSDDLVLVNYGCHPVVLGPSSLAISADYPGYLKQALEAAGVAKTAMFLLAACGNINPRVCIMDRSEPAEAMGKGLAGIVREALSNFENRPGSLVAGGVRGASVEWEIARSQDSPDAGPRPNHPDGGNVQTVITALSAGHLCFLGLPGEPFSEFNAMIRSRSPFQHTFIVSLAQDYPGYFPTDKGQRQRGYEARSAPGERLEGPLIRKAVRVMAESRL